MKFIKAVGLLGLASLAALTIAGRSSAQSITSSPGDGTGNGSVVFTFNNNNANALVINTGTVYGTSAPVADTSLTPVGSFQLTTAADGSGSFTDFTSSNSVLFSGTFGANSVIKTFQSGSAIEQFEFTNLTYNVLNSTSYAGQGYTGFFSLTLNNIGSTNGTNTATAYGTAFSVIPPVVTQTPEPSAAIALAIATFGLGGLLMFRKKQSSVLS